MFESRGEQNKEWQHLVSVPLCILIVTSPVQLPIYPPVNERSLYEAPKAQTVTCTALGLWHKVCVCLFDRHVAESTSLLIRLFVKQERASVNASAPVYPHLNSNQVIFIKMWLPTMGRSKAEISISSGLCATLGNAWVTFFFLSRHRGSRSAFLKYQSRLDEEETACQRQWRCLTVV